MKRTDSMPVKYHKDKDGSFKPVVDAKMGKAVHWNIAKLSSRENPLVLFTLAAQAGIGVFLISFLGALLGIDSFVSFRASDMYAPLAIGSFAMIAFALLMSTTHLGKPHRFYRGFNNLKHSPVAREAFGIAMFMAFAGFHILCTLPQNGVFIGLWQWLFGADISALGASSAIQTAAKGFGLLAITAGLIGLYYMTRCYCLKARPFWNHWQTGTSFFGNMLSLGSLIAGTASIITLVVSGGNATAALTLFTSLLLIGVALEALGLYCQARSLNSAEHEGAASHYIQVTQFGKTYYLRNALLGLSIVLSLAILSTLLSPVLCVIAWSLIGISLICTSLIGRALFYVLVIPTTMPGAFFWKNKGFEEHARDIGLAEMPQVGVVMHTH